MATDLAALLEGMHESNKYYNNFTARTRLLPTDAWESTASNILQLATEMGISQRTSQLALMYLTVHIKSEEIPPSIMGVLGFAGLWIAAKFEGDKVRELLPIKSQLEKNLGEPIDSIEKHVLDNILHWKLSFCTPFDFVATLLHYMSNKIGFPLKVKGEIETKATQITELLLLSFQKPINFDPYAIALASLYSAGFILSQTHFVKALKEHSTNSINEQVERLMDHIKVELQLQENESTNTSASPSPLQEIGGKRCCTCADTMGPERKKHCVGTF